MKVLLIIALVGVALFALAWWRSGRSAGIQHSALATGERRDAEANALKEYRPSGPGPAAC